MGYFKEGTRASKGADESALGRNRHREMGCEEPRCMSSHPLALITGVCPIFLLNYTCNYFPG